MADENENTEIGVPLTLSRIEPGTEVVIAELAMRGIGQIAYLGEIALPDVAVVTGVGPVHLELLGTIVLVLCFLWFAGFQQNIPDRRQVSGHGGSVIDLLGHRILQAQLLHRLLVVPLIGIGDRGAEQRQPAVAIVASCVLQLP